MHPIILAYSAFIGCIHILIHKNGRGFRNKLITVFILIVILIPQIAIRFSDVPEIDPVSFDAEVVLNKSGSDNLISRWGDGTRYYGFNPNILAMKLPYEKNIPIPESFLRWGWLLIPITAFIFSIKHRDKLIAQFILTCFTLCFLTWFPFTGWIFGYFLNARMLARSVWLFPYGLSAVYILLTIRDYIRGRQTNKVHPTKGTHIVGHIAPKHILGVILTVWITLIGHFYFIGVWGSIFFIYHSWNIF